MSIYTVLMVIYNENIYINIYVLNFHKRYIYIDF